MLAWPRIVTGNQDSEPRGVIATTFWPAWTAPALNGAALLLALGFHRNRTALVLAISTACALALVNGLSVAGDARGADAVRMFAPWLLVGAVVVPGRGLFSRPNLVLMLLLVGAGWLSLATPAGLWQGLRASLPFGLLPWSPGSVAATLVFAAAGLCVLRWILIGAPIHAGLGLVLGCSAAAMWPSLRSQDMAFAFALAGVGALLAVFYASYRMAFVDALTGLPNRRALDETLARLRGDYAIGMVDVDHFKRFNDTHGHAAGDRVLRAVAQQLQGTRGCRAYRYGGEEFCLLFGGRRANAAATVCEDLRRRVEAARVKVRATPNRSRRGQAVKRAAPGEARVTVSIGLAVHDADAPLASDVLKAADRALYRAKSKGRNRVIKRR